MACSFTRTYFIDGAINTTRNVQVLIRSISVNLARNRRDASRAAKSGAARNGIADHVDDVAILADSAKITISKNVLNSREVTRLILDYLRDHLRLERAYQL